MTVHLDGQGYYRSCLYRRSQLNAPPFIQSRAISAVLSVKMISAVADWKRAP